MLTSKGSTLKSAFRNLTLINKPLTHQNLTVFPITFYEYEEQPSYLLAFDGLKMGLLKLKATRSYDFFDRITAQSPDHNYTFDRILAINYSEDPILLIEGQELLKDYVVNATTLIPPFSTIPVYLSEITYIDTNNEPQPYLDGCEPDDEPQEDNTPLHIKDLIIQDFNFIPSFIRTYNRDSICQLIDESNEPLGGHADEEPIWEYCRTTFNIPGKEASLRLIYQLRQDDVAPYVEAIPYPPETKGIIVYINNEFAGLDIFDRYATLRHIWPQLISSYAIEAIANTSKTASNSSPSIDQVTENIKEIGEIKIKRYPAIGMGRWYLLQNDNYIGQGLVLGSFCIHLSVLPTPPQESNLSESIEDTSYQANNTNTIINIKEPDNPS